MGSAFNDRFSSVRFHGGARARVHRHDRFGGGSLELGERRADFTPLRFSDRAGVNHNVTSLTVW